MDIRFQYFRLVRQRITLCGSPQHTAQNLHQVRRHVTDGIKARKVRHKTDGIDGIQQKMRVDLTLQGLQLLGIALLLPQAVLLDQGLHPVTGIVIALQKLAHLKVALGRQLMGEISLLQTLHALVQMLHRQHDAPQKQHRKQRVRAQHRGHRSGAQPQRPFVARHQLPVVHQRHHGEACVAHLCGDAPIHSAAGNALRPQETLYGRRQRLVPSQERPIQSQRHPHRARFTVVAFQHLLRVRLKIKACHFQRAPTISRLHLERRRQQQISAPVFAGEQRSRLRHAHTDLPRPLPGGAVPRGFLHPVLRHGQACIQLIGRTVRQIQVQRLQAAARQAVIIKNALQPGGRFIPAAG